MTKYRVYIKVTPTKDNRFNLEILYTNGTKEIVKDCKLVGKEYVQEFDDGSTMRYSYVANSSEIGEFKLDVKVE